MRQMMGSRPDFDGFMNGLRLSLEIFLKKGVINPALERDESAPNRNWSLL